MPWPPADLARRNFPGHFPHFDPAIDPACIKWRKAHSSAYSSGQNNTDSTKASSSNSAQNASEPDPQDYIPPKKKEDRSSPFAEFDKYRFDFSSQYRTGESATNHHGERPKYRFEKDSNPAWAHLAKAAYSQATDKIDRGSLLEIEGIWANL